MTARIRHLRHRELDGLVRERLDHTKDALSLGIPPGSKPEFVFTANNLANNLTVAGEDALAVGNPRVILEGTLPAELDTGVLYWLGDAGLNLYQLFSNKADAAANTNPITFTDDGSGTLTMTILD
jgi:hypothetical protein